MANEPHANSPGPPSENARPADPKRKGLFLSWVFVLFWVGLTGSFDVAILSDLIPQLLTHGYVATTGVITECRLTSEVGDEGTKHGLHVRYKYTVNGREFVGRRYRHGSWKSNDGTWKAIRDSLPVGARVPVYHDPADPARSVLHRGLMGMDLFIVWFLTPFNLIGIGLFIGLSRWTLGWESPPFDPHDPRLVERTDEGWRLRPNGRDFLLKFCFVMFVASLLGIFVVVFTLGFNPPIWMMNLCWTVTPVGSALFAARLLRRSAVTWDGRTRTLAIRPVHVHSKNPVPPGRIELSKVRAFAATSEEIKDSDGDSRTREALVIHLREPSETYIITERWDLERAGQVADWLNGELGLTPTA
jgi:hypothetical protein